ncbi:MAG TPA: RHS repeat-associated core domain-containing protein [Fimbriimonadaceae bacterium]|nr:RHS repeat-associated core domain-containing protein [Fimbriimonadaceae bacterium]
MTYPSLNNEEWSYGANGDVTARYVGIPGHIIGYAYDDAGRLNGIDYPSGTDTSFAYDAADRLVEMIDASGTTEWEYNDADELIELTTPQGVVNYVYKLDGQLEKIQQPSMNDLVYRYDTYGRADRIASAFNEVTDILYDNLGSRVERKNLPNGTHELYEFDVRGRVKDIQLVDSNSGDDLLRGLTYTYNEVDNIVQIVETRASTITKTYDYDAIDQLIEETWSTGYSAEYEYDENGNRTRRTVGTTVEDYFYGDDDELTEIKIGSTVVKSFGYDAAGRRTSATYSGVTTSYAYDYESRITSITRTGVTANSFAYNGFDTRVSRTDSGGTSTYKRAGAYVTDSLLKSTVSSTTTDYTPGVSSRVSGTSTFDHAGLKNTDEQTDSSGDIAASRQYDAFGNVVSSYQTWAGPFGYGGAYGYQRDADHGLMLLGHRYYESDTGRFLTRDPIKDGRNWYGYCGGNPVSWADPLGLKSVRQWIQMGLDVIGIFDPFGVVDTANAITHAVNGEWGDAGLTIIGIIPIVGDVAKVGKWLRVSDEVAELAQVTKNRNAGLAAEQEVARQLVEEGYTIVKQHPYVRTELGRRFPDFLVEKDGLQKYIEVKLGNSRYNGTPQKAKDDWILLFMGIPTEVRRL